MATNAPPAGDNPEQQAQLPNGTDPVRPPAATLPESKLATQKDVSLKEFLGRMDDNAPIVRLASLRLHPDLSSLAC